MTEINPVVRTEIEYARARARKMEERCRAAWQAAVPTLPGAARLARETKSWADRAASWAAVLELLDAPAVTRPLSNGHIARWARRQEEDDAVEVVDYLERARDAGMTPGELLRTPKALWYCDRPGCGHGDNVHGPFCFAAGCACHDFRRTERLTIPSCPFCGHGEHGPDDESMWECLEVTCFCRTERAARR